MSILDCSEVQKSINDCINVAHSLFNRNKVSGSSANLSFRYQDYVVITSSGSSFGTLDVDDFSVVSLYETMRKEYGISPFKGESQICAVLADEFLAKNFANLYIL